MIRIDSNGEQVLVQVSETLRRLPDEVDRAIGRGAQEVAVEARGGAPKAFSTLAQSILVRREGQADYSVIAGARYARYVEKGTGPGGKPPLQALRDWIRIKRIEPADPTMDREQLAHLLQRSIAKRGTRAQPFMQPALEAKLPRIRELLEQAVTRGLR